jgi:pimeloyl-ACP methyl ester carboxylesterase
MPELTVNGTRIWYEFEGEGPPLIQLHGLGLGHTNFASVSPILRRHFRVLDADSSACICTARRWVGWLPLSSPPSTPKR